MSKLPKVMNEDFKKLLGAKTNDNYLCLYVGHIVKSIIGIHNLLNNRIKLMEQQEEEKEQEKQDNKP